MLAVVLVLAGVLAAWYAHEASTALRPVVMVAADVPVGQEISDSDLTTAMVAAPAEVRTIPGGQIGSLAGYRAAVELKQGSLLTPESVTKQVTPPLGQQVVPVALKGGRVPARGVAPGDRVLAVAVPAPEDKSADAVEVRAVVDRVGPSTEGSVVVDLLVSADAGPRLVRLAATDRLAIVVESRERP